MALFLTSLVFDGLDRFLDRHAHPDPVAVVSNASRRLPDQSAVLAMALDALSGAGRLWQTIDVLTDGTGALAEAGAIVMTGGDPFLLRADLDHSGAGPILQAARRRGVPIVGQSAGAIVCGPRLEPIRVTSPFTAPDDAELSGLRFTEQLVLPHHGRPDRNALHRRAAMGRDPEIAPAGRRSAGGGRGQNLTLTPLWDDEVLVCEEPDWVIHRGSWRTRAAHAADASAVGDVFQAAALDGWASFLGRERLAGNRQNDSEWAERIRKPGGRFLVTEDDAGIGAFAHWRLLDEGTGEVDLLYTDPRAQGTGLGRRLLERATWNLLCDGCREAVLWTEARNARALAMYRHNGWVPDGAVDERSYFGTPIRNLRHRLDLTRHAGGA